MSGRGYARVAWSAAAFSVLLVLAAVAFSAAASQGPPVTRVVVLVLVLAFGGVGAVVASRHPENPIGWLFCGIAVAAGLMSLSGGYAEYWFEEGRSAPFGETAAWYNESSWVPVVLPATTFLLLLFPDGRLLTRRWRVVAWCAGIGLPLYWIGSSLQPGPLENFRQVNNPYGVEGAWLDLLYAPVVLLMLVAMVGSPVSLVLRFRRAGREQRQQIKWLAFAGAVTVATVISAIAAYDALGEHAANAAILLSVTGLPLAAGIAILRYRLYDIDVVINRALVYGGLTAILALSYLGGVLLLQLALRPLTESSNLAIAGSTLAVAALFRPARTRIQEAVDRRFYRRKYDAAHTLEAFSGRLRDQVELAALEADLRRVVSETMQPAHMSVWLRGSAP